MKAESRTTRPAAAPGRIDAILACGVVVVCAAVVAGFAWSRPTTADSGLRYTQTGRLSYTAPVAPSSVYGTTRVESGQPVYTSAVRNLRLSYAYRFDTPLPAVLVGSERLVATISNGQGVNRRIPLQRVRAFSGRGFVAKATLRLADLQAAAAAFDQANGGLASGTYPVEISPSVEIHGTLAGTKLRRSFTEALRFSFGDGVLMPAPVQEPTNAVGTTPPGPPSPKLAAASAGTVTVPGARRATLFAGVSVADARRGSLAALAAALLVAALLARRLVAALGSEDERVRIGARHGLALVETHVLPDEADVVTVRVSSFAGLLHVARRLECPILHRPGNGDVYAVVDNGTLYRYDAGSSSTTDPAQVGPGSGHPEPALAIGRRR